MPFLRQSTIQTIRFGPFLDITDGVTEETGLTITQALRRLSKDGGAFAQTGETGNSVHDSDGWYSDDLTAADTGTVGELILNVQIPATALPVWLRWWVIEETVYDRFYGAAAGGYLQATTAANTLDVAATGEAGVDFGNILGTLDAADIGANAITSAKIATDAIGAAQIAANAIGASELAADAIGASQLATDAVTEIANGVWDTDATGRQTAGTFGQAIGDPGANTETMYDAVVTDAAGTNVATDVVAIKAETVLIVADTNELQTDDIPAAIAALNDPTAAVIADAVWDEDATAHQNGGTFGQAIGDPGANAETMYDAVVTDAAGTNVAVDVVAVKAETATIVADTNELQTDDIPGTIAALNNISAANVNTEVSDVLKTDTVTLPAQGAPTNTPTMEAILGWLYKTFRNKKEQTATEWRLFDDAGSVVDSKATVSDAASTATKEEIVTGP